MLTLAGITVIDDGLPFLPQLEKTIAAAARMTAIKIQDFKIFMVILSLIILPE
jgi:hypothetical protein